MWKIFDTAVHFGKETDLILAVGIFVAWTVWKNPLNIEFYLGNRNLWPWFFLGFLSFWHKVQVRGFPREGTEVCV